MAVKDAIRNVYNRLLVNNEGYLKYLRSKGITIGEDVTFHCPKDTRVDITDPHLLTIGNHVNLTGPITILTHDYGWSVVKGKTGEILGNKKPVTIGNNVFVGWGATILCGTTIEDNVIIGAHAVEMREQFFLWADPDHLNDAYRFQMGLMGSLEKSEEIISTPRPFGSFEEFLASCDDIDGEMIS